MPPLLRPWRRPCPARRLAACHGLEGRKAAIAERGGDPCRGLATGRARGCLEKAQAPLPDTDRQARLEAKEPRQRAPAHGEQKAPVVEIAGKARLADQGPGERCKAPVGRNRQHEGSDLGPRDLIEHERGEMPASSAFVVERRLAAECRDRRVQELRHDDDPAARRGRADGRGRDMDHVHDDVAMHRKLMQRAGRQPQGMAARHHPGARVGRGHQQPRCHEQELAPAGGLRADPRAGREGPGHGDQWPASPGFMTRLAHGRQEIDPVPPRHGLLLKTQGYGSRAATP